MKTLIVPAALLMSLASAAEPTVTLAGVQVIHDDGGKEFDGFKTFNGEKGHKVALIVRSPDKAMVGFDDDAATITLGGAKTDCRFFSNMAFAKDRLALRLEFEAEGVVNSGPDGTFQVKGGLPLVFATGKEETRSEPFKVAKGAGIKFTAGKSGLPVLKVKSAGKPDFGDDPLEIELSTNMKADSFAGIRFYTSDGKPVESERGGSSWMGFGGKGSGEISYRFKAAQTELILAVETWTGREEKTLEVDFKAGLAVP